MVLETFSFCFFGPPFMLEEVDMIKPKKKRIHWEDKKKTAFSIRAPTRHKSLGTSPSVYVQVLSIITPYSSIAIQEKSRGVTSGL